MPASNHTTPRPRHRAAHVLKHQAWRLIRLLIVLGVAAFPAHVAYAQASPPPARGAPDAPTAAEIFGGIELTPAQHTQLAALTAETRARIQAITARQVQGARMSSADRAELLRLIDAHRARVRELLTPEQRERQDLNERAWRTRHAEVLRQRYDSLAKRAAATTTPAGRRS